jgi:hypothetical protein
VTVEPKDEYYEKPGADAYTWQIHETHRDRWRHPRVLEAANLTSTLTPIFTPTHPNIIRLRPTRPDESSSEIRVPKAFSPT